MTIILLEKGLSRAMEKKGFEVLQAESVKKGIDTVKIKKTRICSGRLKIS